MVARTGAGAGATTDATMNCRAVSRNMLTLTTGGGAREARRSALISAVERTGRGSSRSATAAAGWIATSELPRSSMRMIVATAAAAPSKAAVAI